MGGISIENYRQRIGSFQFSGPKVKYRKHIFRNPKSSPFYNRTKRINNNNALHQVFICAIFYMFLLTIICSSFHNVDRKYPSFLSSQIKVMKEGFLKQTNTNFFWMSIEEINSSCHALNGNRRKYSRDCGWPRRP